MTEQERELLVKLLSRTIKDGDCWIWQGACARGYPHFWNPLRRKYTKVHRFVYSCYYDLPAELMVMHSCDNKRCVNIAHLSAGTNTDNIRDSATRTGLRDSEPFSIFDARTVRTLWSRGIKQSEIAVLFNRSNGDINNIIHNRRWKEDAEDSR